MSISYLYYITLYYIIFRTHCDLNVYAWAHSPRGLCPYRLFLCPCPYCLQPGMATRLGDPETQRLRQPGNPATRRRPVGLVGSDIV